MPGRGEAQGHQHGVGIGAPGVILAAVAGLRRSRALVAVWRPGQRRLAVRPVRLPDRTSSGSDSFVVW
jgi:hypothetical protein